MLTKREIKELSKRHGFYLKKGLGQNFLIDRNVRDKIIRLIGLKDDDVVLEIGPGLGALTEGLLAACRRVYAVEKDKKIYNLSKELLSGYKNLELIHGDFLKFDITGLAPGRIKVVGALPYYITSPIIERLFHFREKLDTVFIIVQKEVARRLAAQAGESEYTRYTLFTQFYSDAGLIMDIRKDSFFPMPGVDSTLVRLKVLTKPHVAVKDEGMLFKVIRKAFNQRRKTILSALSHKNSLGLGKEEIKELLAGLGIDTRTRAESLTLLQFAKMSDAIIDFLR